MGDRDSKGLRFLYMFEIVQASKKKRNNLQTKKAETLRKRGERSSLTLRVLLIKQTKQRKAQILKEAEKGNDSFGFCIHKKQSFFFSLKKKNEISVFLLGQIINIIIEISP